MSKLKKLNWRRAASVIPGGKPYFWVAFLDIGQTRTRFRVCWDRVRLQWLAEKMDMGKRSQVGCGKPETIGYYFHHKAARDYLETVANGVQPD